MRRSGTNVQRNAGIFFCENAWIWNKKFIFATRRGTWSVCIPSHFSMPLAFQYWYPLLLCTLWLQHSSLLSPRSAWSTLCFVLRQVSSPFVMEFVILGGTALGTHFNRQSKCVLVPFGLLFCCLSMVHGNICSWR